jgi:gliding motility-associated-like protein
MRYSFCFKKTNIFSKPVILFACIVLSSFNTLNAQLWNGSLGPPIVNITFGSDGNYYTPPPGFTTFKQGNGCPEIGKYSITGKVFGCQQNTWLQVVGDHYFPGDVGGQFMIVNAEGTSGTIFSDTVRSLCDNTTYQFAAWITNVMKDIACNHNPALANLSFNAQTLSGTIIGTYNTGDIPIEDAKAFRQYGLTFKTPPSTDAVIVTITTKPPNRCGSGFAIDDITFNECGPKITATIDGSTDAANVCANYTNPFIMNATYGPGLTDPVVQWQNSTDSGTSWSDIAGAITTTYQVPHRLSGVILYRIVIAERENINSPNCRTASNEIYTEIHPIIPPTPPQDFLGCLSKDLMMPKPDPKSLAVEWTGPNGYTSNLAEAVLPNVQYADTGLYKLKQLFYFGCTTLDTFYLKVYPSTTLTVQTPSSICQGMSEILLVTETGGGKFRWTPAEGLSNDTIANPVAAPQKTTEYQVKITNQYGCSDSAYITVRVYDNPYANAGENQVILSKDSITLNGLVKGKNMNYYWSPPAFMDDNHSLTPRVYPPSDMIYTLNAVSNEGCGTSTSSVSVKVYSDLFIPNAFTPNSDGKNDKFKILPLNGYKVIAFVIYDRVGNALFKARNISDGWDGTLKGVPQPSGTYIYYLELEGTTPGRRIFKKGTLLLIR